LTNHPSIEKGLRRIIEQQLSEVLGTQQGGIQMDQPFAELGADSLHMIELVLAIEREFEIRIPERDAERIASPREALVYISERLGLAGCARAPGDES
jgi:acyl carrier protein